MPTINETIEQYNRACAEYHAEHGTFDAGAAYRNSEAERAALHEEFFQRRDKESLKLQMEWRAVARAYFAAQKERRAA
jgi:hypothetical protein